MNKTNVKLTACLVGLFVSLLLVIIGNKNTVCLSFGFVVMGVSIALYAFYKADIINDELLKAQIEFENTDDEFSKSDLMKYMKKLNKQKRKISIAFFVCAGLLVVLGFVNLI